MRCAFETICKSVFLSIILKGLVRWAGAQQRACCVSSTELHLGSLILSSMKWKMTDAVLSFFSFWSGRVPVEHLEMLHVTFTKVKPPARIYINVLFFHHCFLVSLKDKKYRPKRFPFSKALFTFSIKIQIQQLWIAQSVLSRMECQSFSLLFHASLCANICLDTVPRSEKAEEPGAPDLVRTSTGLGGWRH